MGLGHSPTIVMDGLVMCLDAGNPKSYTGSGSTWYDLSGRGNNGTLENGVGYAQINGGVMSFDGSNDRVVTVTATTIGIASVSNPFSISLWFKTTRMTEQYIFDNYDGTTPNASSNISFRTDGGKIEIHITTVGAAALQYGSGYADGVWHNAVVTWRGIPQVQSVYVDGNFLGSDTKNLSGTFETDSAFMIGTRPSGGGQFQGNISMCMVYTKELSAAEVAQNFAATRGRFGL